MSIGSLPLPPTAVGGPFPPVSIMLAPAFPLTREQFFEICQQNADKRLERTADGEIIIMAPAGGETGRRNLAVSAQLYNWSIVDGTGEAYDSSAGFDLPNGATRSPDAAWIPKKELASLTLAELERFIPRCPYFVVEMRSPSDPLKTLQAKMEEYVANGCQLGWLIDSVRRQVHIYRPGRAVAILDQPLTVAADPELPGFTLDLEPVWRT